MLSRDRRALTVTPPPACVPPALGQHGLTWGCAAGHAGAINAATMMVRHEGGRALLKGLVPTLVGIAPYAALNFASYDLLKKWFYGGSRCAPPSAGSARPISSLRVCGTRLKHWCPLGVCTCGRCWSDAGQVLVRCWSGRCWAGARQAEQLFVCSRGGVHRCANACRCMHPLVPLSQRAPGRCSHVA